MLGIAEHFFNRKTLYMTTLCDLRKHKIFDVGKGRYDHEVADYFNHLKGREKVKVVCMDLSSSFRQMVQKYFPHARIVADRFHVVRLVYHQCMQTYQELDPEMKYKRGLLAALRTRVDSVTGHRLKKRDEYLERQPVIRVI